MAENWCPVCCCRHRDKKDCPGELLATGPERQGWRVNVQTPHGIEGCGVLVAPSGDSWRARILTFPNILWTVPDGRGTIKFVGRSPREAERQAIDFLRQHIRNRGHTMRDEIALSVPGEIEAEVAPGGLAPPCGPPALRRVRFLPVRFGVAQITEIAGTGNLSETGLFIITGSPEKDGTWLNMLLEVDEDPIGLRGLVRWKNRQHRAGRSPGMGVQLEEPPPSYLSYVRSLA
jgi:hypothetical protein